MSKELKALEDLISFIGNGFVADTHELCEYVVERKDIIETALKEYELMKQTKVIVVDKNISDDDLEKLKNQRMFVSNLEPCEFRPLFDKLEDLFKEKEL